MISHSGSAKDKELARVRQEELAERIESAENYNDLFELVKRTVEAELFKHRAGLSLILADMPNTVGAYHPVGSNNIVLNRALIDSMKRVIKNEREINTFIFTVLMHEYLHSLGYMDELKVRRMCGAVCSSALGDDHIAVKMSTGNWLEMYPQLATVYPRMSRDYELVERFDSSSMGYIG